MTPLARELDEQIRRVTIGDESTENLVLVLTHALPRICDRRRAHGAVEAAYDRYHQGRLEMGQVTDVDLVRGDHGDRS